MVYKINLNQSTLNWQIQIKKDNNYERVKMESEINRSEQDGITISRG